MEGHLSLALTARGKLKQGEHFEVLPYADIPALYGELAVIDTIAAKALRFLILTAARSGEVLGAPWDENDLAQSHWTIPAARMKMQKPHRVPLAEEALSLLQALPRPIPYVFYGRNRAKPLTRVALLG